MCKILVEGRIKIPWVFFQCISFFHFSQYLKTIVFLLCVSNISYFIFNQEINTEFNGFLQYKIGFWTFRIEITDETGCKIFSRSLFLVAWFWVVWRLYRDLFKTTLPYNAFKVLRLFWNDWNLLQLWSRLWLTYDSSCSIIFE
jgi:hypothetical protein